MSTLNVPKAAQLAQFLQDDAKTPATTPYVKLFVDGQALAFPVSSSDANPSLSAALPSGVIFMSLSDALTQHPDKITPYLAKADADTKGVFLYLPKDMELTRPIYLIHLATASQTHRQVIVARAGAKATLFELYQPAEGSEETPYFSEVALTIHLEKGAVIQRHKLQNEGSKARHQARTQITLLEGSEFEGHYYYLGAEQCREESQALLQGQYSRCTWRGLSMLNQSQQLDNYLVVEHKGPHSESEQCYKNIVGDKAVSTFDGKVIVRPGAVKVQSKQANKNLLVSATSIANTRPALEIYADDVQCSHGATVGQIEADKLFYLRARGIPKALAYRLLMQGFLNDIVNTIELPSIKAQIKERLSAKLNQLSLVEQGD